MKCWLLILHAFILVFVNTGFASSGSSGLTTSSQNTIMGKGVLVQEQGLSMTNRTATFDSLLGEGAGANWPPFPRMWNEEFEVDTVKTTTAWLPSLYALSGGVEVEYVYNRKISLVLISSLSGVDELTVNNEKRIINVGAHRMVDLNPKTRLRYPRVNPKAPMVGLCSYELSLIMERAVSMKVNIWGLGMSEEVKKGITYGTHHTVFSKFFYIPENKPVMQIFEEYCRETFGDYVQPLVEANFVPVVVEKTNLYSPRNECHPHIEDSALGDKECMSWFESRFDKLQRQVSVPRCVPTARGFSICQLRAKETKTCPIYEDKNLSRYTQVSRHGLKRITNAGRELQCDNGLECTMTQEPTSYLWGAIQRPGKAVCVKSAPL